MVVHDQKGHGLVQEQRQRIQIVQGGKIPNESQYWTIFRHGDTRDRRDISIDSTRSAITENRECFLPKRFC